MAITFQAKRRPERLTSVAASTATPGVRLTKNIPQRKFSYSAGQNNTAFKRAHAHSLPDSGNVVVRSKRIKRRKDPTHAKPNVSTIASFESHRPVTPTRNRLHRLGNSNRLSLCCRKRSTKCKFPSRNEMICAPGVYQSSLHGTEVQFRRTTHSVTMIGKRATKVGLTRGANRRPMLFNLKFSSDVIQYKLGRSPYPFFT